MAMHPRKGRRTEKKLRVLTYQAHQRGVRRTQLHPITYVIDIAKEITLGSGVSQARWAVYFPGANEQRKD